MIHRADKRKGKYASVSNTMLRNTELSLKAKGLLALMLSMADGWEFSVDGLAELCKDGKSSVLSAVRELEGKGYLSRRQGHDENGNFSGYVYEVYESPLTENPSTGNPSTEKPSTENRSQRKPNNKKTNNKKTNIQAEQKKPKVLNGGRTVPSYDIGAFEAEALRPVLYRKKG